MSEEFYIGWQTKALARTGKAIRTSVVTLLAALLVISAVLAFSQRSIGRGVFEWGKVKEFSGMLKATPVPHLVITSNGTNRFCYLVRPWKFGFDPELAAKFDGEQVTLRGTLIHRDDQAMVEVERGSVARSDIGHRDMLRLTESRSVSLGEQTFVGEIVDSKCFLGVMNPGQLKPHRACAVRCISGGVPPVLLVRQSDGSARYLVLVSRAGKPVNQNVLEMVAEPVRISGELVRDGEVLTLRADPSTYRRFADRGAHSGTAR